MFNKKLLSSIDLGKYKKKNPYKKDIILDPMGQWKHPGKNTRIPSSSITMKGVNYPVLGVSNTGQKQMMQPGKEYNFPGADYVDEYPQMKKGRLTKAQKGIATYQDSLDVYNNALQQQAFYNKLKPYYDNVEYIKNYIIDFNKAKEAEKELLAHKASSIWTPQDKANFQKTKNIIAANKDKNIAYLTDIVTPQLDPNAPALRYDARIEPQGEISYYPKEYPLTSKEKDLQGRLGVYVYDGKGRTDYIKKGKKLGYSEKEIISLLYKLKKQNEVANKLKGYITTLPYYDPLAVKPGKLLTDDEIKKRVKLYGTTGIPIDRLTKLGLNNSQPPKTNTSTPPKKNTPTVVKSPCSNPITTVINNVPEKAPFGKKLVGTDEETFPVTGKKCEYIKTINPIYEDIKIEPIELQKFPVRIDNGPLPPLQMHDYTLPDSIEAPQYTLDPYTADRLSLDVKLPQNKIAALFDEGVIDSKGHIALGKRNKTRLIPRIVQKATGYDPAYFEGYEDEEGNFVPGELEIANELGNKVEFKGAASLRDYINQQKYAKEYEEYQKKLDEWDEKYEQSKKKQEQGQAFKKGGAKKKYTSDIINSTNYLFAEHPLFKKKKQSKKRIYDPKAKYYADGGENLQEECPPYYYWNGETCVPVDRKLAPLDPQYLLENPDVATNMQIEPEVSVSPLGSDFSKSLSWINKWHDSPMHDKMLLKSSKLSTRTDSDGEKLFKEIKDLRKKNIQTIPSLKIGFDKTDPNAKLYEDTYDINLWGWSDNNTGNVSVFQSLPGNKQMLVHETSHSADRPAGKLGRLIPYNDQLTMQYRVPSNWKNSQYGKNEMAWFKNSQSKLEDEYMGEEEIPRDVYEQNQFDDWNKYLLSNQGSEVRARLNEIRSGAQEQNIYDPFNKKITGRQFKNLKNLKYTKPLDELRKTYSDRDIKWMLNNISKNDNETDDAIQYGKKGGVLPKAQPGGLTRFINSAGKILKLPPPILHESNILPKILPVVSNISKDLKIGPGVKNLLADARYRSGIESEFPLIEYLFPSASIRQLGDYKYKPYSEGWWAEHDMKTALEQPQWVPGKEDFFTDQEIIDLVKQQKDYNKSLAAFDEMHPESSGMEIMRALSGDTSRDELFANLFPNASLPNFRSKILSPEQTAALNRIELQNKSFQNKAGLSDPALKTLGVGQDILPKQYNDLLTFYKGSNWLKTAPAKDVIMEMRGLPELKGVDIKNASPLQLETWRDKIVKKMEKQAIERWKKDRGNKLTGLDAYNKMLNQSGSRNKYGGQLPRAQFGGPKGQCPIGYEWNGVQCVPNPFETRPSQRAAVYMDKDGNYQIDPAYQQYSQQKFDVAQSNKKAQDFNKMYAQSKNYKRLLKKQGYTPEEIEDRINSIMNINDIRYTDEGPSWVGTNEDTGNEFISYNVTDPGDWPGFDQIAAHEWGHVGIDSGANPLKPKEREEFINRINKEQAGVTGNPDDLVHDMEPQENRADLLQLRQQLQEAGVFDSTKRKRFTKKDLKKYKDAMKSSERNWDNMWNRMFRLYDDDSIIYFMNNVAKNNSNEDLQVAKYGFELDLTEDEIQKYVKGGYVVEDISVPSLTRMQPGGLIETAAKLLKQATPGNKVRSLIYSGIDPAGYGLRTKLLNFPKELSLTKAANETRPFRVGMSLQNPQNLSKFLLRNNMANSDWDALSDFEKMQMMSKEKVDKIVDIGKRRLDAWAVGLKQPQEYNTLEQVGDNTFRMKDISYDPEYFSELYTDILAKNMLDKNGLYLDENPLVTIAKQHYDRTMHPHLRGLLGFADQNQLGKDAIAKLSKMTRSQIDKVLGYPTKNIEPWKQNRIVELSKINQDPNFKYSIYDDDQFGVMGGFRWDLADTPEGMLWQANDTWDLNPWQQRGETRVDTDPFIKKLLTQHYKKPLQHLEVLSLVGGKPFDIQNNFLIQPGTFKTIKQFQTGGQYNLGDEVDEATMKQLKELGYTFEKI